MRIRQAVVEDLARIIEIEQLCFPAAEAADSKDFAARFAAFGKSFFVAEEGGCMAGFINGCVTDVPKLPDALYHDVSLHKPEGNYQTVFGLAVLPEYRRQGIGEALLRHMTDAAKARGKRGVILTCKDPLISFYEKAGFKCQGVSASEHGGAKWNDMLLLFPS